MEKTEQNYSAEESGVGQDEACVSLKLVIGRVGSSVEGI